MKNPLRRILTVAMFALLSLVTCHSSLLFGQSAVISFYQTGTIYPPVVMSQLTFPATAIGASAVTQSFVVQNTGTATAASLTVSVSTGNTSDFSITTSPATNCGGSLTVNATCTVTVTFTPTASGARSSTVAASWTGSGSPGAALTIAGTGIALNANALNTVAPVIPVAATLSLTAANCNALVQMGATTGEVVTLPAPIVGCTYQFAITVSNTSNYNEIRTDGSSHFLLGAVGHSATGIAPLNFWADGSTIQAIKMDGAHLGGLIGSTFDVTGISSTQWEISGTNECTATCTTAFTATP